MTREVDTDEPAAPAVLVEVQSFLQGAFRSPRPLAERVDLHEKATAIARPSATLSPTGRVDVYREQFVVRHQTSLRDDFPTLELLLGPGDFALLCERYLEAYPPRHFMLRNLSEDMAAFLERDPRYASDTLLADCARVEWAFLDAADSADPRAFDPSALAGAPEDAIMGARLVMQRALRLVKMDHPAHELRNAIRSGDGNESKARPAPRPTYLAVFRRGESVHYIELERPAFEVVRALVAGEPLGEACAHAIDAGMSEDDVATKLGEWFQSWTQWGWLEEVVIASS